MSYTVLQWPDSVFPGEVTDECPEAMEALIVLIREMEVNGPSPDGYAVKALGKKLKGLWQINLKEQGRQVRVLYAPYDKTIVLFRIHKKSSPQEQTRGYDTAMRRKREYEKRREAERKNDHGRNRTFH